MLAPLVFLLLAGLVLGRMGTPPVLAQEGYATGSGSGAFVDVPPDHWAFDAIRRLAREGIVLGYEDGRFRGRKIVTRFDLAYVVAKALERSDKLRAARTQVSSEAERLLMRLTIELRTELSLLGIRVDGLERRVQREEDTVDALEERKSNIRIDGFYRLQQTFVRRPVDFDGSLFIPELDPFRNFVERGPQPLEQQVFLRLAGAPFIQGTRTDRVEVFAELLGIITGPVGLTPNFRLEDPIVSGDTFDDIITDVSDDQRISFNRGHLVVKGDRLRTRLFANESSTDLTDPSVLYTVDSFQPFSGVEVSGSYKKLGYFGSALKKRTTTGTDFGLLLDRGLTSFPDPAVFGTLVDARVTSLEDITDFFSEQQILEEDVYTTRITYEPSHLGASGRGRESLFGLSYVEQVLDYKTPDAFNRVYGADYQWGYRGDDSSLSTTVQWLRSDGEGPVKDNAYKLDSTFTQGRFLANFKGYAFGRNFRNRPGQFQFVDTNVFFNFRRELTPGADLNGDGNVDSFESTRGERLARVLLRYSFAPTDLQGLSDLSLSSLYELKSWERDPANPLINDETNASRFNLQVLADVNPRLHLEVSTELEKDLPLDRDGDGVLDPVEGKLDNSMRLEWRVLDNLTLLGELQLFEDLDEPQSDGNIFKMKRSKIEAQSQVTPSFFIRGSTEKIFDADLQLNGIPARFVNGRNIDRQIGEAVWAVTDKFSIHPLLVLQLTKNRNFEFEENFSRILVTELIFTFNRNLRGRYIHAFQDTDLFLSDRIDILKDILNRNDFFELIYEPTESTELRLSYGTEYENPLDPLDNGPAKFDKTAHIIQLKMQTAF